MALSMGAPSVVPRSPWAVALKQMLMQQPPNGFTSSIFLVGNALWDQDLPPATSWEAL